MGNQWGAIEWPTHRPVATVAPTSGGRATRGGVTVLALFAIWMVAGRALLADGRPPLPLVGWEVIRETLELGGHAPVAFKLALAILWVSVPVWAVTGGFRHGGAWLGLARLTISLGGLAAAVPLLVAGAVVAANVVLLAVLALAAVLFLLVLLLRLLTAPFRW